MIASLWSNPNFDDGKNTRTRAIEEIEENYDEAISGFLNPTEEGIEVDEDNPFFQAMEKGVQKLEQPRNDEGTVKEVIERDIDQD